MAIARELMVVTEELSPYQYTDSEKQLTGYSVEVIQAAFQASKINTNIQVLPWARAYKLALTRPNTLIFSLSRSKLRENKFIWGGKLLREEIYFWRLKSKPENIIKVLNDIKDFNLSVTRYSNPALFMQEHNFKNIALVDDSDQNVKMLASGHVDFIIGTALDYKYRANKLGIDFNQFEPVIKIDELSNDLYFAFSQGTDPDLIKLCLDGYNKILLNGELALIRKKWQVEF